MRVCVGGGGGGGVIFHSGACITFTLCNKDIF